jgi:beta-barrel assembly-enhancing protease
MVCNPRGYDLAAAQVRGVHGMASARLARGSVVAGGSLWARAGVLVAVLLGLLAGVPAQAGLLKIPVAEEIKYGKQAAAQFEATKHLLDGAVLERIQAIGDKVARQTQRPDLPYTFHLVDDPAINAITFPGGQIYVYRGLMDASPTDDELAAVLAHECAHAAKSHTYKTLWPSSVLGRLHRRLAGGSDAGPAAAIVQALTQRGLSRQLEYEADRLGMRYAAAAGFDPKGMIGVLEFLQQTEKASPNLVEGLLRTHPKVAQRLRLARLELARLQRAKGR